MSRTPRAVGWCREIVAEDGKECGGVIRENLVKQNPLPIYMYWLKPIAKFLLGETKIIGFICDKCGAKYPFTDPSNLFNSMSR